MWKFHLFSSLSSTQNLVLFNLSLPFFRSVNQLPNSPSTDLLPIFVCVICKHLLIFVGSTAITISLEVPIPLWAGLDISYYQIQSASHPKHIKSLSIVYMCFRIFWDFHLVVITSLLILHVPPPTRSFQQLLHILPLFIPYFHMDCYQVILYIRPMQIHHQLLLLHSLLIQNGVLAISTPRNIVGCSIYLWNLRKGWINVILTFSPHVIHCLLLIRSRYFFMVWYCL